MAQLGWKESGRPPGGGDIYIKITDEERSKPGKVEGKKSASGRGNSKNNSVELEGETVAGRTAQEARRMWRDEARRCGPPQGQRGAPTGV